MRKSLGKKRREIPDEARADIVRIYANFLQDENTEGEVSRVFDTADFGYREIRVERPLKLNFEVNTERLARLADQKPFAGLDEADQAAIKATLQTIGDQLFTNRDTFEKSLNRALKVRGLKIGTPIKKAILAALSERDDEADVCVGTDGKPEADAELRDHELVPLKEGWRDYMRREVLPFVPDAWVDEAYVDAHDRKTGRVGYEINFNRYFFDFFRPSNLQEVDYRLDDLRVKISKLLEGVI
jgi:type I restriction enzyme M protein